MIAGHEVPTAGDITVGGARVTHLPPARPRTAMMFQSYALFPRIDWVDNVAFSPRMRRVPKVERRMKARDAPPCRNGNPGGAAPFDRPGTTFVAHFVGGHNLLRYTVEAAAARMAGLRTGAP